MSAPPTVLLVSADTSLAEQFRAILALEEGTRLLRCRRPDEAADMAREARPNLVVVEHGLAGGDAFRLCRALRAEPDLAGATLVLLVPAGSAHLKLAGLVFGVDEYLDRPIVAADLLTKVRWTQRVRALGEELHTDRAELERLREEQSKGFDHLLELLVSLLELRLPGCAARAARVAELAATMAERFEVPIHLRRDLAIAARLHELGRVLEPEGAAEAEEGAPGAGGGQYVLATRMLLKRVEGLQEAAEIAGAIFENWDGTGFPRNLLQGQIPLRARILRALVDYTAALQATEDADSAAVLERMAEHRGTRYDPMVIVHLQELLAGAGPGAPRVPIVRVPIASLEEGMVLAEDLCTDSGLKLLSRGTKLTASALGIIRKRHQVAPILEGAAIVSRAA